MRNRFWVETGLAVLAAAMLVLTVFSREWIEVLFGVDPDGGSGSLEWLLVGVLVLAAVGFSVTARLEWRRAALRRA